jgi:ribosomal protein L37AE/L43A
MRTRSFPIVICPGCKIEMAVVSARPVPGAERVEEIIYRCPKCGTETARRVAIESARSGA